MKVNDTRHQKQELSFDELEWGKCYVSSRLQKYLIFTEDSTMVCLQTGATYQESGFRGDVFEPVNAVLEIK